MSPVRSSERLDRLTGALLGCAIGDALGLPAEGMSAARIARRFGRLERYRLCGSTGFVSDDLEQAALLAQSLARAGIQGCVADYRRALLGWFWRFPFGLGLATLRSCWRMSLGFRTSGVDSAGNGAAMRVGVLGVYLADDAQTRRRLGQGVARVTHLDERAIEGALYVAEVAARITVGCELAEAVRHARQDVVSNEELGAAIEAGIEAAADPSLSPREVADALGTSGFVIHTIGITTYSLLKFRGKVTETLASVISVGGDTDTNAAIVGTWLGVHLGAAGLPENLVGRLHDGPFGPTHLRSLAQALHAGDPPPGYSPLAALARNLALWIVVLFRSLQRLLPG